MTAFDIDHLCRILRDAALAEVMPRFRRLSAGDVRRKTSAIDLVTEADEAAERHIAAACASTFPTAAFVGEEAASADPSLLDKVGTADLAIVVDPIDGTANFAAGAPLFAVMAAVVARGRTIAGVIYDPLGDDFVIAEMGGGAYLSRADGERTRLTVAEPVPLGEMIGFASASSLAADERRLLLANLSATRVVANYRCAGQEYRLAATGHVHYALYQKLMPWDHLAGALILSEAGGYVRRVDGSPYRPGLIDGRLLCATDEASWHALRDAIFAGLPF